MYLVTTLVQEQMKEAFHFHFGSQAESDNQGEGSGGA